jgi:hypothetical protein
MVPGGSFAIDAYNGAGGESSINPSGGTANVTSLKRVFIPCAFTPNAISFKIKTGAATCAMEIGLYNAAGTTLLIHSGVVTNSTTVSCATAGVKTLTAATSPAATGLGTSYPAGWYWLGTTAVQTTLAITAMAYVSDATGAGDLLNVASMSGTGTNSSGGALPSSIGTVALTNGGNIPMFLLTY